MVIPTQGILKRSLFFYVDCRQFRDRRVVVAQVAAQTRIAMLRYELDHQITSVHYKQLEIQDDIMIW